jgi:hypothetical protein
LASLRWAEKMGILAHYSYYVPSLETLSADRVFSGQAAEPISDVYPAAEQKKVYDMAKALKPGFSLPRLISKIRGLFN